MKGAVKVQRTLDGLFSRKAAPSAGGLPHAAGGRKTSRGDGAAAPSPSRPLDKKARLLLAAGGGGSTSGPLDKKARLLAKFAPAEANKEPTPPLSAFAVSCPRKNLATVIDTAPVCVSLPRRFSLRLFPRFCESVPRPSPLSPSVPRALSPDTPCLHPTPAARCLQLFSNVAKARLKAANPDCNFVAILQKVKGEWTEMPSEERAVYEARHAEATAQYEKDLAEFSRRQDPSPSETPAPTTAEGLQSRADGEADPAPPTAVKSKAKAAKRKPAVGAKRKSAATPKAKEAKAGKTGKAGKSGKAGKKRPPTAGTTAAEGSARSAQPSPTASPGKRPAGTADVPPPAKVAKAAEESAPATGSSPADNQQAASGEVSAASASAKKKVVKPKQKAINSFFGPSDPSRPAVDFSKTVDDAALPGRKKKFMSKAERQREKEKRAKEREDARVAAAKEREAQKAQQKARRERERAAAASQRQAEREQLKAEAKARKEKERRRKLEEEERNKPRDEAQLTDMPPLPSEGEGSGWERIQWRLSNESFGDLAMISEFLATYGEALACSEQVANMTPRRIDEALHGDEAAVNDLLACMLVSLMEVDYGASSTDVECELGVSLSTLPVNGNTASAVLKLYLEQITWSPCDHVTQKLATRDFCHLAPEEALQVLAFLCSQHFDNPHVLDALEAASAEAARLHSAQCVSSLRVVQRPYPGRRLLLGLREACAAVGWPGRALPLLAVLTRLDTLEPRCRYKLKMELARRSKAAREEAKKRAQKEAAAAKDAAAKREEEDARLAAALAAQDAMTRRSGRAAAAAAGERMKLVVDGYQWGQPEPGRRGGAPESALDTSLEMEPDEKMADMLEEEERHLGETARQASVSPRFFPHAAPSSIRVAPSCRRVLCRQACGWPQSLTAVGRLQMRLSPLTATAGLPLRFSQPR